MQCCIGIYRRVVSIIAVRNRKLLHIGRLLLISNSMEKWMEKTQKYLSIGEGGRLEIFNVMFWIVY